MAVYLVSPNILNKVFYLVHLVSLVLWSYHHHTVELKLNKLIV